MRLIGTNINFKGSNSPIERRNEIRCGYPYLEDFKEILGAKELLDKIPHDVGNKKIADNEPQFFYEFRYVDV